jgi:hypothetical protein
VERSWRRALEALSALYHRARATRIVHLTERGREVADAILKLAALLREERAESF